METYKQLVSTHNISLQLPRYFLPEVSISNTAGRDRPEDPRLDTQHMRMERSRYRKGGHIEGSCSFGTFHSTKIRGKRGNWDDKRPGGDSDIQGGARNAEKILGQTFLGRGYLVSTIGVNERIIRQYLQKQELKERQAGQLGPDW